MSLQVWLPLTKDLRNQGLENFNITTMGTLSFVDGKLGKAINFNNSTSSNNAIVINSNLCEELGTEYSATVWVYPFGSHVDYNGCIISSGNWNTPNKRWSFGLSKNNSQVDVFGFNYNTYVDCNIPLNTWTHIACVHKNGITKLYKNGIYIGEKQMAQSALDSDKTFTRVGMCSYGNYFGFNGKINDLRIYDHALSEMEVKQISQGLVLHYPLNRKGWGQENLARNTGVRAPDSTSQVEFRAFKVGNLPIVAGETITVSFDLKMEIGTAVTNGTPYLYVYNTNYRGPHGQWISFTNNSSHPFIPIGNYAIGDIFEQRVHFTTTVANSFNPGSQTEDWIEFYSNYNTENKITINNLKIEKGSIATPWCPNSSDELATTMGLNSTIEYDCSGFCNNGNKMTDTITYTSDTAKYQVSTHFNGTYDGILIENLQLSDIINSAITYAFWIKPESESGARSVYFGSYSGNSWSIEKNTSNVLRLYWNGSPDEHCSGATIADGVWQHVCITKSGTSDVKVYINGVQKWNSTTAHNNLSFPTTYRLGRDIRSNDGTPYKGLMSDFRIYATALSASDVNSLYNQGIATT